MHTVFDAARYGKDADPLPEAALTLLSEAAIDVRAEKDFLAPDVASELNPMSVTVVRADGLPPTYTGTPFKAPFQVPCQ